MSVKAAPQTECEAMIERLLALEDIGARQHLIEQQPSLDWNQVVSTLSDRVREEVRVDTARAQLLADIAINVAEKIGSNVALAKSLRAKGNALYSLDQHSAAIEMQERAARLFEAAGEEQELARTL